jgi:hypothetical protein
MIRIFHPHASGAHPKVKRAPREKRTAQDRPVRMYSLLLPPTFPRDRR